MNCSSYHLRSFYCIEGIVLHFTWLKSYNKPLRKICYYVFRDEESWDWKAVFLRDVLLISSRAISWNPGLFNVISLVLTADLHYLAKFSQNEMCSVYIIEVVGINQWNTWLEKVLACPPLSFSWYMWWYSSHCYCKRATYQNYFIRLVIAWLSQ